MKGRTMSQNLPMPSPNRNIYFFEQVNQQSVLNATKSILEINAADEYLKDYYKVYGLVYEPKPIKVYIDSYGGMVYQILGLVSVVENSKAEIHTICTGTAMSAGAIFLMSGHKRFAYKNSTVMIHQVSSGTFGALKEMEDNVHEAKRLNDNLCKIITEKTKIKQPTLNKLYKEKIDWYLNSQEAKKNGIIDDIIE